MNMTEQAKHILHENDMGNYTIPTKGLYPYQWNWDAAFSALGLARFNTDRAFKEVETLLSGQWDDGMLPHIIFHETNPGYFPGPDIWRANIGPIPSSGISQPPVLASVVLRLADSDLARAGKLFDKIDNWHRWWHKARDPFQLGVMAVIHPWESGRDNLPDWDTPGNAIDVSQVGEYTRKDTSMVSTDMRPTKKDYDRYLALIYQARENNWQWQKVRDESSFLIADVGVTAILLRAEKDLLVLANRLGKESSAIAKRIAVMEQGFDILWNEQAQAYCSKDLKTDTFSPYTTSASFLSWYADVRTHENELLNVLEDFSATTKYLVASFDPRHELFDHICYWRGPVWPIVNYMIASGLDECGHDQWAHRIRSDTAKLMRLSGFSEYYSPVDGRGCGGGKFSWTAAIWLAWNLDDKEDA